MKQLTKITCMLFVASFLIACSGLAQEKTKQLLPWVSEKGYWVAEGNIKDPYSHTIRFYTPDDQLIHTQKISGVKLDFQKRKTKMKMKKALEQTLELYSRHLAPAEISEQLVACLK